MLEFEKSPNKITIFADQGKRKISRHIYGHFTEHLGRCIYDGIWVGEDSDIPNVRGIRSDIVKALKGINTPNLRWPGGCFADTYHWIDGIGPKKDRPKMINVHWGGVTEDNSFGTHEFMDLCEQLNCEPVICGNVGSGTVQEMAQWIEYLTSDNISPMTELRKKNDREKPWKVPFWGIGNENWGCGGNMSPQYYSDLMRHFSTYCLNYGENKLNKIACGAYEDNFEWTEVLMKNEHNRKMMNGLSYHYYTICHDWKNKGSATQFDESEWFSTMNKTLKMEEYLTKHSEIMDKYDPEKQISLVVDEWGNWFDVEPDTNPGFLYQQNTLRDALIAGINLNIFNNHCDRVRMANIAQTVNVLQSMILTKKGQIVFTPTYYIFKMYKAHHDAVLLPLEIICEDYAHENNKIPAITASASKDKNGIVHLSLTNVNPNKEILLQCDLKGNNKVSQINGQILTASEMNAFNDFDKDEDIFPVEFKDFELENNILKFEIPSKSVIVMELKS